MDGGEHEGAAGAKPTGDAGELREGIVEELEGVRGGDKVERRLGRVVVLDGGAMEGDGEPGCPGVGAGIGELGLGDVDGGATESAAGQPDGVLPLAAAQLQRVHAGAQGREQAQRALAGQEGAIVKIVRVDARDGAVHPRDAVPIVSLRFHAP